MSLVLADEDPSKGYFGVGPGIETLVGGPKGVPGGLTNNNWINVRDALIRKGANMVKDEGVEMGAKFVSNYDPRKHRLQMASDE